MGKNSVYWRTISTNTFGSARSYIPEVPWNNSCASELIAKYVTGSSVTYGTKGFCNTISGGTNFLTTLGGSGGPSGCATETNGKCTGYAKPSWQKLLGVPGDGVRDVPDVSLFSAGIVWGHAFIVCLSDPKNDFGAPCSEFPNRWEYGFGTSFAAPIMAGVQALINNAAGSRQGNPNPTFYQLARGEYGSAGSKNCNSSLGNKTGSKCIFYDVTQGDDEVPCVKGSPDCYLPSGTHGVLSTSDSKYKPAYVSAKGWDFATGIGTINVANLLKAWPH
jgi:hypothetical protein